MTTCPDVSISKLLFKIHMHHFIMRNMQNSLFPTICISAVSQGFSHAYLNTHENTYFFLTFLLIYARAADLFDRYSDVRITGFSTFSCQSARVPIRREVLGFTAALTSPPLEMDRPALCFLYKGPFVAGLHMPDKGLKDL